MGEVGLDAQVREGARQEGEGLLIADLEARQRTAWRIGGGAEGIFVASRTVGRGGEGFGVHRRQLGVGHLLLGRLHIGRDVLVEDGEGQQGLRGEIPLQRQVEGVSAIRVQVHVAQRRRAVGRADRAQGQGRHQAGDRGARHDAGGAEADHDVLDRLDRQVQRRQDVVIGVGAADARRHAVEGGIAGGLDLGIDPARAEVAANRHAGPFGVPVQLSPQAGVLFGHIAPVAQSGRAVLQTQQTEVAAGHAGVA
ncbi:hypothetical protein D3C72_577730 [compost metagenome]